MRKINNEIFKKFFSKKLNLTRNDLGINQEEMGFLLQMSRRAYSNLECEKFGGSSLTLALYLIYLDPDPITFLNELKEAFENDDSMTDEIKHE